MCRPKRAYVPTEARERADRHAGDGMVDAVARRDDVMAQICELVSTSDPAGADAFVRSYYGQLGDDDLATWTTEELATAALEHWRFGARRPPARHPPKKPRDGGGSRRERSSMRS